MARVVSKSAGAGSEADALAEAMREYDFIIAYCTANVVEGFDAERQGPHPLLPRRSFHHCLLTVHCHTLAGCRSSSLSRPLVPCLSARSATTRRILLPGRDTRSLTVYT